MVVFFSTNKTEDNDRRRFIPFITMRPKSAVCSGIKFSQGGGELGIGGRGMFFCG